MSRAQLAILPVSEGRQAERRVVNLAARLREPGATIVDAEVLNLSIDGFMAESDLKLEPGANVWLKLPGLEQEARRSRHGGQQGRLPVRDAVAPGDRGNARRGQPQSAGQGPFRGPGPAETLTPVRSVLATGPICH